MGTIRHKVLKEGSFEARIKWNSETRQAEYSIVAVVKGITVGKYNLPDTDYSRCLFAARATLHACKLKYEQLTKR